MDNLEVSFLKYYRLREGNQTPLIYLNITIALFIPRYDIDR